MRSLESSGANAVRRLMTSSSAPRPKSCRIRRISLSVGAVTVPLPFVFSPPPPSLRRLPSRVNRYGLGKLVYPASRRPLAVSEPADVRALTPPFLLTDPTRRQSPG